MKLSMTAFVLILTLNSGGTAERRAETAQVSRLQRRHDHRRRERQCQGINSHRRRQIYSRITLNTYVPYSVLTVCLRISTDLSSASDKEVDEVTDMFAGMNKKKKKSSKSKTATAGDEEAVAPDAAPADGIADFDATILKKKKKKSPKTKTADVSGDFEAKLAEAGIEDGDETTNGGTTGATAAEDDETSTQQDGDLEKGTGIWNHNASAPINYNLLLTRFFALVNQYNPDILSSGSKSYKIPPPQCLREGNKKTIFANIADICKRMKRTDEHVTQFLFAELGTSGSVDGSKRLVIKGRFQQKQIENVLRRYIGMSPSFPLLSFSLVLSSPPLPHPNHTHRLTHLPFPLRSGIRNLQNLPQPRHRAKQRREPPVLCDVQFVRKSALGHGHQERFHGPGRKEKTYQRLISNLFLHTHSKLRVCFGRGGGGFTFAQIGRSNAWVKGGLYN